MLIPQRPRNRKEAKRDIEQDLLSDSSPRLHMLLIVILTACCGVMTSVAFLHAGMKVMALRYPLAVIASYLVFLISLKIWLSALRHREKKSWTDNVDFSGEKYKKSPETSWWDFGGIPDLGEWFAILVIIIMIIAACWSAASLVWDAPEILADLLLDLLLAGGLYRVLRTKEPASWLRTAFKRTLMPFFLIAVLMGIFGGTLQSKAPDAVTMSAAVHALHKHKAD